MITKSISHLLLSDCMEKFKHNLIITGKSNETVRSYFFDLKGFNEFIEKKYNCPVYANEVLEEDIEEYLYFLKTNKLKSASISRNLYTLRSFYNFAYKNKFCDWNIAANIEPVKVQRPERTFLKPEEVSELVGAIEHPLIVFVVETLYYTGLRISECVNLKCEDVDIKNRIIHVIQGKGGKDRNIPINKHLADILKNYTENYRPGTYDGYFFATEKTGRLSTSYVNRVIYDTVKKLGWEKHVSAHILRHSFASNLIKNGVSLVYVQKLLGHSNLKVTSIYTHTIMDELDKSVNLL